MGIENQTLKTGNWTKKSSLVLTHLQFPFTRLCNRFSNFRFPISNFRLPVSNFQFPISIFLLFIIALTCTAPAARGQEKLPEQKAEEAALPEKPQPRRAEAQNPAADSSHRFWDRRNVWLFSGVAAMRAVDYHSTGNMRRRGRDEILLTNSVVDSKPAFAAIQAGAVLTSVGLSYLFHRTRHHKLERWVSILHIGVAGFGAVRNYCLDSHPLPAPSP
jgi:hypothetical protein